MFRARLLVLSLAALLLALAAGVLFAGGSQAAPPTPMLKLKLAQAPKPAKLTMKPARSLASTAQVTAARTFVSTSGADANPCTNSQPCRNFAAAITKTTPGGEVVALTSGGYGPVAIGMAITLVGAPGVHAAITATSGNAIEVAAGGGDTVVLRNLYLNGLGGTNGILYTSGRALALEQLTATGFGSAGVWHQAPNGRLHASDLVLRRNSYGLLVDPASGTAQVSLDRVQARDNLNAGIYAGQNARLRISDSVASGNGWGILTYVPTTVSGCQLSENTYGFYVGGATVGRIGGSTVTHNNTGLYRGSGTLESFGDNYVRGNTSADTFGTITTVPRT